MHPIDFPTSICRQGGKLANKDAMRLKHILPLLCLCLFFSHSAALYAGRGAPPRHWRGAQDLQKVVRMRLPAIDPVAKLADDAQKTGPGPLRFAEPMKVDLTPGKDGTWETLADGSRVWRLRFQAPGATDLNFGFKEYRLPKGAELLIYNEAQDYFQGPFTAKHNKKHGQLWTPVVPGDSAVLELHLPAGGEKNLKLKLTRVGAGYRDLFHKKLRGNAKQGSCNIDTSCPEGDDWRDEIRSVARLSIEGIYLCTGTLLMDAQGSFRDLMISAHHCEYGPQNAASIVAYWNYESPSCGQLGGGDLWANTQSGVTVLAQREDVDFALLELEDKPPPQFNVYYAGWDRTGDTPSGSVGIHHPNGDEKAISINTDPLLTVDNCIAWVGRNTHWSFNWEKGVTEEGSSGSGLWSSDNHKFIGYLSGGDSYCGNPKGFDCYGKFALAWDGDSPAVRLRDWLDPDNTGVMTVDGANAPPAPKPANDDFTDAIAIDGEAGKITGNNFGATLESGEPDHAGAAPDASVWWQWTAQHDGSTVFDTIGSDFDTVLAVYTGDSIDALTEVASNNDHQQTTSWVRFNAEAGTVYHIAVAGFNKTPASGIVLNWNFIQLGHYLFYDARALGPQLPTFGPIALQDALGLRNFNVGKGKRPGLSAKINAEGSDDAPAQLFDYPLTLAKGQRAFQQARHVHIINECNDLELKLIRPKSILLPTNINLLTLPSKPAEHAIDHFICYDALLEKNDADGEVLPAFPKNTQVVVEDALQTRRYDLKKVTRYCEPAELSGAPRILQGPNKGSVFPIAPATVAVPSARLTCYQATLATTEVEQNGCGASGAKRSPIRPRPKSRAPESLFIANQFESNQFLSNVPKEVCLSSIQPSP